MTDAALIEAAPTLGSGHPSEAVVARLAAQPGIQRVPSPKLTLFLRRGFLDSATCAAVIARIDAQRRPSTISDPNGDAAFRTSETCDLDSNDPVVAEVEAMITGFTGLDPVHGEPMQGQRYAVGQEFKGHTDYFEPAGVDYERYCGVAGNRTWTVMIYLNEPEAGGATRFKTIDKIVQPETGKLLAWNNRRPDGSLNPATIHQGMKVRSGVKYVITKWFRERPWGWA
ncbi:2OG-Fe(II) oxygenase [Sphingomonas oligophenolica]|uniref:2OG-Fe(II) oxygenase n=1 Tax=Sphingomonas oligophenolica TaxID=301154 RepID=A0ABU9XXK7_9SPHN